jgi:hypothetical protein
LDEMERVCKHEALSLEKNVDESKQFNDVLIILKSEVTSRPKVGR